MKRVKRGAVGVNDVRAALHRLVGTGGSVSLMTLAIAISIDTNKRLDKVHDTLYEKSKKRKPFYKFVIRDRMFALPLSEHDPISLRDIMKMSTPHDE